MSLLLITLFKSVFAFENDTVSKKSFNPDFLTTSVKIVSNNNHYYSLADVETGFYWNLSHHNALGITFRQKYTIDYSRYSVGIKYRRTPFDKPMTPFFEAGLAAQKRVVYRDTFYRDYHNTNNWNGYGIAVAGLQYTFPQRKIGIELAYSMITQINFEEYDFGELYYITEPYDIYLVKKLNFEYNSLFSVGIKYNF